MTFNASLWAKGTEYVTCSYLIRLKKGFTASKCLYNTIYHRTPCSHKLVNHFLFFLFFFCFIYLFIFDKVFTLRKINQYNAYNILGNHNRSKQLHILTHAGKGKKIFQTKNDTLRGKGRSEEEEEEEHSLCNKHK